MLDKVSLDAVLVTLINTDPYDWLGGDGSAKMKIDLVVPKSVKEFFDNVRNTSNCPLAVWDLKSAVFSALVVNGISSIVQELGKESFDEMLDGIMEAKKELDKRKKEEEE